MLFQFSFYLVLFSQDIDVFKRDLNDRFKLPKIPSEMTQDEFSTLSTNIRLMDAVEAIVVPGLIHFKLKENKTGFALLGARVIGYAGLYYVNHNAINNFLGDNNQQVEFTSDEAKRNTYITLGSIFLVAESYFYDWIHGRDLLEIRQQKIRYKYSLKLSSDKTYNPTRTTQYTPELSLQLTF